MSENFRSKYIEAPEILSPNDGLYFYGYYDMCPARADGSRHLAHRVAFMDRLQKKDDEAELGYFENGAFVPFAKTTAWNFQQGAMLRYLSPASDKVLYNVRREGGFSTVVHDLATGERTYTDRACAAISPDGKHGVAINFPRVFDFRPGYGYAGTPDPFFAQREPEEDGAFLVDLASGRSKLLLSYKDLARVSGLAKGAKILINHVTFNPDGTRFVMLVRSFPEPGRGGWLTSAVVSDLSGSCAAVMENTYVSHYWWRDEKTLLAHCTPRGANEKGLFFIDVGTGAAENVDAPYLHPSQGGNRDVHCSISPDGRYVIGDGYPIEGMRYLLAIDLVTGRSDVLFGAATVAPPTVDVRCDLHARFIAGGKLISFDTTHNGVRQIAAVPADLLREL